MSGSLILRVGRIDCRSELCPEFAFLVTEIKACTLVYGTVHYVVGIPCVKVLSCRVKQKKAILHEITAAVVCLLI